MEAGPAFSSLAQAAGGSASGAGVRRYLPSATGLPNMAPGRGRRPPVPRSVLEFSGDDYDASDMAGDPIGSPQYYAKYRCDLQAAIQTSLGPYGAEVFLVGHSLRRVVGFES